MLFYPCGQTPLHVLDLVHDVVMEPLRPLPVDQLGDVVVEEGPLLLPVFTLGRGNA